MTERDLALQSMSETAQQELVGYAPNAASSFIARIEEHAAWEVLSGLPMILSARIPMQRLTVRNLLELRAEQVLQSTWPDVKDIPLNVGDVCLGWTEFEVSADGLGVRLTRLA